MKAWQRVWQIVETDTYGVEDGIADGRRNPHDWRFTRPRGCNVLSIEEDHFNLRDIAEARHPVHSKVGILDAPILKFVT